MSKKSEILLIKLEAVAVLLGDSRDPHQTIGEFRRPYLARIEAIKAGDSK